MMRDLQWTCEAVPVARVVGVAVAMVAKRPRVRAVVLDGSVAAPVLVETFEVTTQEADHASQVHDLATSLANRVGGLGVDRVMIQRADYFRISTNQDGPRVRLLTEGALIYATYERVPRTQIATGREVAAEAGMQKDDLIAQAGAVLADPAFTDACCAALAVMDQ